MSRWSKSPNDGSHGDHGEEHDEQYLTVTMRSQYFSSYMKREYVFFVSEVSPTTKTESP